MKYLIITPARNEETFIERTIQSVIAQAVHPVKWVIVSDGSTDRTDEIVNKYVAQHNWIQLVRMPERRERHFAGKVGAFNAGYECVKNVQHDVVVSLDADISFDEGYFEFLLGKLAADPKLGITGTPFSEGGKTYDYRFSSTDHVSGACQVFRRECFEAIGGYVPAKGGGIDVIACMSARMKGWRTRTFPEKTCEHHKPMGSGNSSHLGFAEFKLGQRQYRLGFHPLWQILRSVYQMTRKPYVIGGMALCLGYFQAGITGMERLIGPELMEFQRQDQLRRLRSFVRLGAAPKLASKLK